MQIINNLICLLINKRHCTKKKIQNFYCTFFWALELKTYGTMHTINPIHGAVSQPAQMWC